MDGACYAPGESDPKDKCQICDPATDRDAFTEGKHRDVVCMVARQG